MFIFDQFKKSDPQLQVVAFAVLAGLALLLTGLWWVQVVSARDYQANLETQSFRTVRIPAVRGKILDRNGAALAENRPTYNVSLYLAELRTPFNAAAAQEASRVRRQLKRQLEEQERKRKRKLTKEEKKPFALTAQARTLLRQRTSYQVASQVVQQISQRVQQPILLDATNFQ